MKRAVAPTKVTAASNWLTRMLVPGRYKLSVAQTLDEHPAKAVPSHVHRGNLPIIVTPLGIKMQQDKAQQVPAGFIQKGRVIVSNVTHRVGQAHAQEAVGHRSRGPPG